MTDEEKIQLYEFADTTPANMTELYTIKQACDILKISKPTLYALIHNNTLLTIKISERGTRVLGASIVEFLFNRSKNNG